MNNKRGSEDALFFLIWELLAITMVLIIILVTVRGVVNNTAYWKTYYSSDLGMIADIANINQGDFVINYALKDFSKNPLTKIYFLDRKIFEILLTRKSIEVYDYPKEQSKYPTVFPFAKHKNINVMDSNTNSDFLVLTKRGNELKISGFFIESAEVCPSYSTSKDTKLTKFNSISLDNKVKQYSDSIKQILGTSRYGTDPNAKNDMTLIITYDKENFIIYYSDDENTFRSQKLSCLLKQEYEKTLNLSPEIKKYTESQTSNTEFSKYITNKEPEEFFVIVQLSDKELLINKNDFAMTTENAVKEYYK